MSKTGYILLVMMSAFSANSYASTEISANKSTQLETEPNVLILSPILTSLSQTIDSDRDKNDSNSEVELQGISTPKPDQPHYTRFFQLWLNRHPQFLVQVGAYSLHQGSATQQVDINGLVGDNFVVTNNNNWNALVGVGHYLAGQHTQYADLYYGVNAYYLAGVNNTGNVIQEDLYTNLAYSYRITNWPIFFGFRAKIKHLNKKFMHDKLDGILIDLGMGPDIIHTSGFGETSLDNGITEPDHIFSGRTGVSFAATAGIGIRFNHLLNFAPVELGYKWMYLGPVNFKNLTQQTSMFNTGNNYVNSIVFTVII